MSTAAGSRSRPFGLPLLAGVVGGALAYAVGYALSFAVLVLDVLLDGGGDPGGGTGAESQLVKVVGTLYSEAHFLTLQVDSARGTEPYHLLEFVNLALPNLVYHLVPVAVLLLAGFLVAARVDPESRLEGARAGATVVLAYLPLVALGAATFAVEGEIFGNAFTITIPVVEAVLRAGLVYPLLLGSAGGIAAHEIATD